MGARVLFLHVNARAHLAGGTAGVPLPGDSLTPPSLGQVAGLFHDPSIGNPIHITVVRLVLLEEEEVRGHMPTLPQGALAARAPTPLPELPRGGGCSKGHCWPWQY